MGAWKTLQWPTMKNTKIIFPRLSDDHATFMHGTQTYIMHSITHLFWSILTLLSVLRNTPSYVWKRAFSQTHFDVGQILDKANTHLKVCFLTHLFTCFSTHIKMYYTLNNKGVLIYHSFFRVYWQIHCTRRSWACNSPRSSEILDFESQSVGPLSQSLVDVSNARRSTQNVWYKRLAPLRRDRLTA